MSLLLLAGVLLFPQACEKVEDLRACQIDEHCGNKNLFRCVADTCVRRDPCGAGIFRFFGRGSEASPYIEELASEADKKTDDEIIVRQVFSAEQLTDTPRQPTFDGEAMLLPADGDRYPMRFEVDFFDNVAAKNVEERLQARNNEYLGAFVEARVQLNENTLPCAAYMSVWVNKDNYAKICLGGDQGISLDQGERQKVPIPIEDPNFLLTDEHTYRIVYKPVVDAERNELVYQVEIFVDSQRLATFSADEVQEPTEKPTRFVLFSFGSESLGGSRWDFVRWGCNPDGGPCVQSFVEDDIQDCTDTRNSGGDIDCPGGRGVADEVCDNVDNNCDGTPDEVFLRSFGPTAILLPNPQDPNNLAARLELGERCQIGLCGNSRVRCDPTNDLGLICDPNAHFQAQAGVGAEIVIPEEVCNGEDDDCDGFVDEDFGPVIEGRSDSGSRRYVDIFDLPENRRAAGASEDDIKNFGRALREACGKGVCGDAGEVVCDEERGVAVCSEPPRPSSAELCGNAKDDDCDGEVDEGVDTNGDGVPDLDGDKDNDGFQACDCAAVGRAEACADSVIGRTDCDDQDRLINPLAVEICNDKDDNCDGHIDEGFDEDGDGFWQCARVCTVVPPDCVEGVDCCRLGPNGELDPRNNLDCDDRRGDADAANIFPGADELCNNRDDDCDGKIDEGPAGELGFVTNPNGGTPAERGYFTAANCGLCGHDCSNRPEREGKGWRNECVLNAQGIYACSTACAEGFVNADSPNSGDSTGCECEPDPLPADNCEDGDQNFGIASATGCTELCNGVDDDCDGSVDEGAPINPAVIETLRAGGQIASQNQLAMVTRPCFTGGEALAVDQAPSRCKTGRMTCSGGEQVGGRPEQCLAQVLPLDGEICNGVDDDCDGQVDEDTPREGDACSVPGQNGVCSIGTFECNGGQEVCVSVYQARVEICNGVDDNCNGRVDEGFDQDSDGFNTCGGVEACGPGEAPATSDGNPACNDNDTNPFNDCVCSDDCNDTLDSGGLINRLQIESCNNLDDNCDGRIDERFVRTNVDGTEFLRGGDLVYSVDTLHCSQCGLNCEDLPNVVRGSTSCFDDNVVGACSFECAPNYEDRDLDWTNGCEVAKCTPDTVGVEAAGRLGQPCSKPIYEDPDPNDNQSVCACRGSFTCVEVGVEQFAVTCIVNPINAQTEEDIISVADCEAANGGERELIRNDREEVCDGFDNNCDGQIDEDFKDIRGNYSTLEHCGACENSRCVAANGSPQCIAGVCTLEQADCAQNFYDANNDLSDGCEYFCVKRAQDDRACNGEDDDCDGCKADDPGCDVDAHIDEDVRFDTDVNNCGRCGQACEFTNAFARCIDSQCAIDRPADAQLETAGCIQGFADCNGDQGAADTGCTVNISEDRNNCGRCGTQCDADGADGCIDGVCACNGGPECIDPNRPICDSEGAGGEECVQCLQSADCEGNPVFNNVGRVFCIDKNCRECDPVDSAGCVGTSAEPICDRQSQSCRGCLNNSQCTVLFNDRQVCITAGADQGECVLCDPDTNEGCGGSTPTCERTAAGEYVCRACQNVADCGGGRTCILDDPNTPEDEGRCSGCNVATNEGCSNPTPICRTADGVGERCEVCAQGDCDAGQECVEGSCRECNPQTNEGCAPNQLCCNFECVQTNAVNGCEACGVDCDGVNSRTCLNRECVCGAAGDGACGGATPFCDDQGQTCVSCRDNADCPPGPRPLCVDTEVAPGQIVPQCQECEPGTNAGCDADGTTPFCDPDRYICRGCAENNECQQQGRGQCVANGSCQLCNPADDEGCSANGASVCTDDYRCVGCLDHAECANNPNGNICIGQRCEGCAGADADARCGNHPAGNVCLDSVGGAPRRCGACDEDLTGNGGTVLDCDAPRQVGQAEGHSVGNICRNNTCVGCVADAECVVANPAEPFCVNGSRCQACDPDSDLPCSGATPVCNPFTFQCEGCQGDNDCNDGRLCVGTFCRVCDPDTNRGCAAAAPVCAGDPPTCRPCVDNAECAGSPNGAFCFQGQCRGCNPATDEGCAPGGNTPVCSAGFACVGCSGDGDCATNADNGGQCVGVACEACDPADHAGCGADAVCCVANGTPVCQPTSGEADGQCTACGIACDPQFADSCTGRLCGCGDGPACTPGGAAPHCGPSGCEECLSDDHCAGDTVCNPATFTCEPCRVGTNAGCALGSLCCDAGAGPSCVATGAGPEDSCTSCDASCDQARSNLCTDRGCKCGNQGQCLGGTPFCNDAAGTCVQCLDDNDCAGETLCVNFSCGACNPQDNSGCNPSGAQPFCRDDGQGGTSCQACQTNNECLANPNNGSKCDQNGGACVECLNAADCGLESATPVCDNSNTCARCTGDGDCAVNPNGTNCDLVSGRCVDCVDNADCGLASATPFCGVDGVGDPVCLGCSGDADCVGNPSGLRCDGTGRCENCVTNAHCDAASASPTCDAGTRDCRACAVDGDCTGNVNGEVCNVATGACQACVDDNDCGANELCCDQGQGPVCVPTDDAVRCTACDQACTATTADSCVARTCVCGNDAECNGGSPFCEGGGCVECRTGNDGDCPGAEICRNNACGVAANAACVVDADCASSFCQPVTNLCRPAECNNGNQDNGETGVDCGGQCGTCNDVQCAVAADCASGFCQASTGLCRPAHCGDGNLNAVQLESGVDCGGPCGACDDNACDGQNSNESCASGYCQAATSLCRPATCTDGVQSPGEAGVDCGGNCGACDDAACVGGSDALCTSGYCQPVTEVCKPLHCGNGLEDGGEQETGVDCGGGCGTCPGQVCAGDGDCASGFCEPGTLVCRPAACNNNVQDAGEAGVDCGGTCGACNDSACDDPSNNNNDGTNLACASGFCQSDSGQCRPSHCGNGGPLPDGDETSVDCGGSCGACTTEACGALGAPVDSTCASGFCHPVLLTCVANHCNSGGTDADETGVDCGGADCGACDDASCDNGGRDDSACASGYCQPETLLCRPALCGNGAQDVNDGELGIDCGGVCGLCNAENCALATDCASGLCQAEGLANKCRPITCTDGLLTVGEADTDCGGDCGPTCDYADACGAAADCASSTCGGGNTCIDCSGNGDCSGGFGDKCVAGDVCGCAAANDCGAGEVCVVSTCRPGTCDNQAQDAGEAGVDCGGACGACAGTACVRPTDCRYDCTNGSCTAAP